MAILTYTSYDEVRAVLGVSTDELEDPTLALALYDYGLQAELNDISAALPADFATVAAITSGSRTTIEQWFLQTTKLFAAYAVAKQLGTGLPLFGPKDISDGKATVSRFADSPYKESLKRVEKEYNTMKVRLESAYAQYKSLSSTTVVRSYMRASAPTIDAVTGS